MEARSQSFRNVCMVKMFPIKIKKHTFRLYRNHVHNHRYIIKWRSGRDSNPRPPA